MKFRGRVRRVKPSRVYTISEACSALECSWRTLRRWALAGKPARFYRPRAGNRDEVIFDADEVDAMRPQARTQVLPPAGRMAEGVADPPPTPPSGQTLLLAALGRLLERVSAPPALPPPPSKEWLTPAEAAAEQGLSEGFIRRAIAGGSLRVVRDGRNGFKVHRSALASLATLSRTTTELREALAERRRAANG